MNITPPALALPNVPPSQTASELTTDHGPDTRGRASLRALFRAVGGVAVHRRTGEWAVSVRVTDSPDVTEGDIRARLLEVPGARVVSIREFPAQWRAERLFRAVVVIRDEVSKPSPSKGELELPGAGGLLPRSAEVEV